MSFGGCLSFMFAPQANSCHQIFVLQCFLAFFGPPALHFVGFAGQFLM